MPQKSFDILPPRQEKKYQFNLKPAPLLNKKRGSWIVFVTVSGILLFALGYFYIEPKAEIILWPRTTPLVFETEAEITGTELVAEEEVSGEFYATGSAEKKSWAEGIITVYNNYHLEQILVATTRFWCFVDGQLREFKTKKDVVIPAGQQMDVEVRASAPGSEYNIPPCTFSIPGLKGGPRYTAVYGKSFSPMTGGEVVQVAVVTREDLDSAKEKLAQQAFEKSRESVQNLISSGNYIFAEGGTRQKIIKEVVLADEGQETDKFECRVRVQTKSLALKKSDLEEFAKEYVSSRLAEGKEIQESSWDLSYSMPQANLKNGKIWLNLKIKVNVYSSVGRDSLKKRILGKKLGEAKQILAEDPELEKASVRLWPFWTTQIPADIKRIDIQLAI